MGSLWNFLTVLCFAMPITGALSEARLAKVGFGGYAFAVTIGAVLGVCCALVMRVAAGEVLANLRRRPSWERSVSMQKWFFSAFYLASVLWMVFALFFGGRVTAALLGLVFRH